MVPLKRAVWGLAVFLIPVALATTSVALHEHSPDTHRAGHADCDVCHFRHLPVTETDSAPVLSAPELAAHAIPSVHSKSERGAVADIRNTRGPPA